MGRLGFFFFLGCLSAGQVFGFQFTKTSPDGQAFPIEIDAQSGITCEQKGRVCTARGDVIVRRGDLTMTCDVLTATFQLDAQGRPQDLILLDAVGSVRMKSDDGTQRSASDRAIFHVPQSHLVLTGKTLFLGVGKTTVHARDSLEYFDVEKKAIAKGEARLEKEDRLVRAQHMEAFFNDDANDKLILDRVIAHGDVFVSTPTDVAQGDEGVYTDKDEVVVLKNNVKITRQGQGHMVGQRGRFDMKKGVAHLLPALRDKAGNVDSPMAVSPQPATSGRVKVLLLPRQPKSS
jgi:lipopolysaccharide export system protein LptA